MVNKGTRLVEDELLPHLPEWRRHFALSRRELAVRAELDETTIKRLEDAGTLARPKTVRLLAHGLGISPDELRRSPA
jgi:ribosome-binding protein aMBF1 (putative translation factor)